MPRRLILALLVVVLILVAAFVSHSVTIRIPDSQFVAYRYAEHVMSQAGDNYNTGEVSRSSPPWLEVILLSLGAASHDLPAFDTVLNLALVVAGASLLYVLLSTDPEYPVPLLLAGSGAVLYVLGVIPWQAFYTSQLLIAVIVLGAFLAMQRRKTFLSGFLAGVGVFAGLEALLAVGLMTLYQANMGRFWRGILLALLGGVICIIVFKIPWRPLILDPNTDTPITALSQLLNQNVVILLYLPLAVVGWRFLSSTGRLLVVWAAVHILIMWLLLGNLTLIPAWIAVIVLGVTGLTRLPRWAAVAAIVILIPGQLYGLVGLNSQSKNANDSDQVAVGQWLDQHSPANATVGSDLIGRTAYYAQRSTIDMEGRLEPNIAAAISRGDLNYGPLSTLPDYFVTSNDATVSWQKGLGDWFNKLYSAVTTSGTLTVYARQQDIARLGPTRSVDIPINDQLRLVGTAQNTTAIEPNGMAWFRLDWQAREGIAPYRLDLSIFSLTNQLFSLSSLPIMYTAWHDGTFSTYHVLVLGSEPIPSGLLPMLVKVSYAPPAPEYPSPVVQHIRAKSFVADVPASPINVLFGDKGNQVHLRAAALGMTDDHQLKITLYWESLGPLAADYQAFVHLALPGGTDLVAQSDNTPVYPTSTWEQGEIFADVRTLPLANIPAGTYWIDIGLYNAQLGRLKLPDGQDILHAFTVRTSDQHSLIDFDTVQVDSVPNSSQ